MAPRWILTVVLALLPQTSLAAYCHGSVSFVGFFFYRKLRNGVETSMRIVHLHASIFQSYCLQYLFR